MSQLSTSLSDHETRGAQGDQRSSPPPVLADYLTEHDLADQLGLTVRTLQRWRSLRCGPAWTKAMRRPMYSRAAVRKWLQGQEQQPIRSRGPMRNSK